MEKLFHVAEEYIKGMKWQERDCPWGNSFLYTGAGKCG